MLKYMTFSVNRVKTLPMAVLSNRIDLFPQQTRNTFILKRKNPLPLHKKNQKPRPMKARYFVYELIENTNTKKRTPVSMVLTKHIKGIGNKGDLISEKPERAYNKYLLPQLAVYATPENIAKYKALVDSSEEYVPSSISVGDMLTLLETLCLPVTMSKDMPWTLEKWHLRVAFRKLNIYVPEDAITMPEKSISGPDLLIENKEFYVVITINNCEKIKVRCRLLYGTPVKENEITYMEESEEIKASAIFPEDQPILDSLPKPNLAKTFLRKKE